MFHVDSIVLCHSIFEREKDRTLDLVGVIQTDYLFDGEPRGTLKFFAGILFRTDRASVKIQFVVYARYPAKTEECVVWASEDGKEYKTNPDPSVTNMVFVIPILAPAGRGRYRLVATADGNQVAEKPFRLASHADG